MREFLENFVDTVKDKRFSWRFKICNIITNDWLRNEVLCISICARNTKEDAEIIDSPHADHFRRRCELILKHVDNIWRL